MNQRVETEPETLPDASGEHIALVLSIADRGRKAFADLAETVTMSPDDQAAAMGELLDDLDMERARLVSARDGAYRLAELEALIEGAAQ